VERAIAVLRSSGSVGGAPLDTQSSEALDVVYRCYKAMVLVVARQILRSDTDAEDVLHDVFSRLPWTAARYGDRGFGGWLKRVTERTALMRLRAIRRRREDSFELDESHVSGFCDGCEIEAHERTGELRWAISRLPDSLRDVVVMRAYDDLSHLQIARRLGISSAASEIRFCRAIKLLRQAMRVDPHRMRKRGDGMAITRERSGGSKSGSPCAYARMMEAPGRSSYER
jgi:RNA polymerase sigma factor (sigma-70 family)